MAKRKTLEQFIEDANLIHDFFYIYEHFIYINNDTKSWITCPIHGDFEQTPHAHLAGQGCPLCGIEKRSEARRLNRTDFINRANIIHNYKYSYEHVPKLKGNKKPVPITCPIHGDFKQSPDGHLSGQGCPECKREKTIKMNQQRKIIPNEFIKRANKIHENFYDYSLIPKEFNNNKDEIPIVCPIHGVFHQIISSHLSGQGCPECRESRGEKKIRLFLNKNNIIYENQKKFKNLIDKKLLSYDFYISSKKLLIEYNGGQHYKPVNYFGGRKNFLKQKHHDWMKRKYAKENGYKYLVIPYWDFNNIEKILTEELKKGS